MTDLPPLSAGESLRPGDANDHVLALQQRLTDHGYLHDAPDGVYGESTEAAVREFQRERGLIEDGVVGERTWEDVGTLGAGDAAQAVDQEAGGLHTGDLSEDGHWRWSGQDWVPAHQAEPEQDHTASEDHRSAAEPGLVSEDGQWVWDGEQWRANPPQELTPELFQEVIAQSIQVTPSGTV
ncbi:peptidoglycan-binding protein [Actinokineospora guangxiensis]|uniref:Peptidoglycan-binding protein n=1 Tax=Actinokineospora guangxiensis TaxID=1490288 RepID=A0ABW0EME8_9PSEU